MLKDKGIEITAADSPSAFVDDTPTNDTPERAFTVIPDFIGQSSDRSRDRGAPTRQ